MTDRVREAVFSSLGGRVEGAVVADLFAGTGSIGLEALSRGAAAVTFVERSRRARAVLDANIAAVGLGGVVVAGDVEQWLDAGDGQFDLAFVDPPYALSLPSVESILGRLAVRMVEGGIVVLHRRVGTSPAEAPDGMAIADRRRYGDSEISRIVKETS